MTEWAFCELPLFCRMETPFLSSHPLFCGKGISRMIFHGIMENQLLLATFPEETVTDQTTEKGQARKIRFSIALLQKQHYKKTGP